MTPQSDVARVAAVHLRHIGVALPCPTAGGDSAQG